MTKALLETPLSMTVGTYRPRDNFDALRLGASALVVVGHGYVLTGLAAPRAFGLPLHTIGVCTFFAISGYMIAGSWERSPRALRFLWHRFLRIFPALGLVVIATVLVLGPIMTTVPITTYFSSLETYRYFEGIALVPRYELPGVFESDSHSRAAVNGSLWTLGVEFTCYAFVLVIGLTLKRARVAAYCIIAVAALSAIIAAHTFAGLEVIAPAAEMVVFFCFGAVLRIAFSRTWFSVWFAVPIVLAWLATALAIPDLAMAWAWMALPYCVITFGLMSIPIVRSVALYGDFSYGTYLWAYPVQQSVLQIFGDLPLLESLILVSVCTGVLAICTWHLVEKRALARKDFTPFTFNR